LQDLLEEELINDEVGFDRCEGGESTPSLRIQAGDEPCRQAHIVRPLEAREQASLSQNRYGVF